MDEYDADRIKTLPNDQYFALASKFVHENIQNVVVQDSLDSNETQEVINDFLLRFKAGTIPLEQIPTYLTVLLIITRDIAMIDVLARSSVLERLQAFAMLELKCVESKIASPEIITAAQKCMCNLIYQSSMVRKYYEVSGLAERITERFSNPPEGHELVRFYDARLLFLLTALVPDIRYRIRHKKQGIKTFNEVLNGILSHHQDRKLYNADINLLMEILKILFNLTISIRNLEKTEQGSEVDEADLVELTKTLRILLCCSTDSDVNLEEIRSNVVNVLINMPVVCYEELGVPLHNMNVASYEYAWNGLDVEALSKLIDFLEQRLQKFEAENDTTSVCPVLQLLILMCRKNRLIRKYTRSVVLPFLGEEVMYPPNEGNSLRNMLIRLMTNPNCEIKALAAAFLFILCKENVSRFIKYTGFGNAAGLLADMGLMLSTRGPDQFSSASEDSETETYEHVKDLVNPVTGYVESPKPNPISEMSEEQKEFEAMKIVEMLSKLNRSGVITPAKIGPDGKPVPVEHILELRDELEDTERKSSLH